MKNLIPKIIEFNKNPNVPLPNRLDAPISWIMASHIAFIWLNSSRPEVGEFIADDLGLLLHHDSQLTGNVPQGYLVENLDQLLHPIGEQLIPNGLRRFQ